MTPRRSNLFFAALTLIFCVGVLLAWLFFLVWPIVWDAQGVKFKVHTGASFKSITTELTAQHIIQHPFLFKLLVHYKGAKHHLKAGEYLFPKGTTPGSLIDQVVNGTGMVYHFFTIVPGHTFQQVRETLNHDDAVTHTSQLLSDADIMKQIGHPELHAEGEFFPETYYFVAGSSDIALLKRAFLTMQTHLNKAWAQREKDLPYQNAYQALIAASIIEKETGVNSELPMIAGVLVNRLKQNMMLQFDPTVIYGVSARYDGTIYKRDLHDLNPYNTYVNKGLPPTPISMPSLAALNAVMHPDHNNYLYFVARGDGKTHQFSHTLEEHVAAVSNAKLMHPEYFNSTLVKQYLNKSLTNQ